MSNVTLTKEQAEAIAHLRTLPAYKTDDALLIAHAETVMGDSRWVDSSLNDLTMDTFARAILNGFDIQKTPEEEVKTFFWLYDEIGDDYEEGIRKGALRMLEIYGIKVKGVNA